MKILILILFAPLVYAACIQTTTTALTNQTFPSLNQGECVNITDINAIIPARNYTLNDQQNLTAFQISINPVTNTVYTCNYNKITTNRTLYYSESYINSLNAEAIYCPALPKYNVTKILDYGDSYINSETNENISCKTYPKLNINQTYGPGASYTEPKSNITVNCAGTQKLNVDNSLKCGEKKEYPDLGIIDRAPACANVKKTLDPGEVLSFPDLGIDATAPNFKENITLSVGQNKLIQGGEVSCNPTKEDILKSCSTDNASDFVKDWQPINTTNATYQTYVYVPIDNLTNDCNVQEKYQQRDGIIQCWNRNILEMKNNCNDLKNQLAVCQANTTQLSADRNNFDQSADKFLNAALWIAAAILLGAAVVTGYQAWQNNMKKGG